MYLLPGASDVPVTSPAITDVFHTFLQPPFSVGCFFFDMFFFDDRDSVTSKPPDSHLHPTIFLPIKTEDMDFLGPQCVLTILKT